MVMCIGLISMGGEGIDIILCESKIKKVDLIAV